MGSWQKFLTRSVVLDLPVSAADSARGRREQQDLEVCQKGGTEPLSGQALLGAFGFRDAAEEDPPSLHPFSHPVGDQLC